MSKAYVIKNGKNFYWFGEDAFFNVYDGSFAPFDKNVIMFGSEDLAEKAINRNELYDCTIVPVTICEGDLEEENRVLKKALELACEELETRDEGKTHARLFIQKIKNNYLGDNVGYEEYYIQQAKESEKDE